MKNNERTMSEGIESYWQGMEKFWLDGAEMYSRHFLLNLELMEKYPSSVFYARDTERLNSDLRGWLHAVKGVRRAVAASA